MRENISEFAKKGVIEFRKLDDIDKINFTSVILNYLSNGLINDGNYLDSDEAYENDKLVLESEHINLDDPMKLATNLLIIASKKTGITINPNGKDIEPYIGTMEKINPLISKFFKLRYVDKIDFITEILYDVSEIEDVEKIEFDFNELINELLTYRKENFGSSENNSLEIEES